MVIVHMCNALENRNAFKTFLNALEMGISRVVNALEMGISRVVNVREFPH